MKEKKETRKFKKIDSQKVAELGKYDLVVTTLEEVKGEKKKKGKK